MRVVLVWNGPLNERECDPIARRQIPLLQQLTAQGVSPVVALFGDRGQLAARLEQSGVVVERLSAPLPPSATALRHIPRAAVSLRAILRRHNPDVVDGDEPMPAIAAGLAASGGRAAIVYRRHHGGGRRRLLLASRLAARLAHRTAVSCEAMRRMAAQEDRTPLDRIDVTASGMPPLCAPAPEDIAAARRSLGIETGTRVIVCVSRLRYEKGVDVLLASLPHLGAEGDVHVIIAGTGPEEASLRAAANRSPVPVHFVGHQQDIGVWLALADVVALPSRRESFGRVTLEAMAMGRPIVAAHVGGLPDAITSGENGLLVPPDDSAALAQAMRSVLNDAFLAAHLGDGARRRYQARHTIDHMATAWREGWERALTRVSVP